ncbi:putative xylanase/chitin deacetylase [Desulfosporosinus orientis DSM 765]|uniref:Putative xylanase/chitin deacetylase n=1 Tax=Desulfosporosinus orientis (strain ATCC 19365 / DSM 765 / NCIMB 8382 / VKM B-1628 / Singapore I) TaxID=768706 RepID=G7W5G1_DESOD|nr:polysaccharide deacetylase family protein [Desulfosporosinus orientis]AET66608.1 putative xylanase/chitin deacetylase [Desulfosporosinus orientis DSM 765]
MQYKLIRRLLLVLVCQLIIIGVSGCREEKKVSPVSQTEDVLTCSELSLSNEQAIIHKSSVLPLEVPVLYYHSIMFEEGNEVRMPPDQFEAQMAYMKENNYESITLDQLYEAFFKEGLLPAKPFIITFDDGYEDNYTTAFPILERHGFSAVVFMVSSYIDGDGFLSWSQLKELSAHGWEIEGHTVNHPNLSQLDVTSVFNELSQSKELLERGLGIPVNYLAYPYGILSPDIVKAAKDAEYLMAFTTDRGWADLELDEWHLKRVYCFVNMGISEFSRRLNDPDY